MALSANADNQNATKNRLLNKLNYAVANVAEDISTATTSDIVLIADADDNYEIKYGDADNLKEILSLDSLTATDDEINRVADLSARIVALSGSESITAATHDGKTLTMGTTDVNATLPAATGTGARFRFVVTGVPATTSHTIACAGSDEFNGHCIQTDVDTSDTLASYPALVADNFDLFTMNGTTSGGLVGDVVEVEDVASGVWALRAFINSSGSVGSPLSSS